MLLLVLLSCTEVSIQSTKPDVEAPVDSDLPTETDAPSWPPEGTDPATDTDPPVTPGPDTDPPEETNPPQDTSAPGTPNPCGPPVIDPYVLGGAFGGFQSRPGSGYQETITVTLPCPATRVEVTILDPDFPENWLVAFDGPVEVGRVAFIGDGTPGVFTSDQRALDAPRITRLELVPDPADYVAYELVLYY